MFSPRGSEPSAIYLQIDGEPLRAILTNLIEILLRAQVMTRGIVKSRLIYVSRMDNPQPSFILIMKKVHRL